ncbi:MAG: MraY family glycosyltransferase [Patescibacteria group bacterium]|jgi:UDP-GlcNAc:undecaprenyl-phosphate GlcNAc-1-phosphate transferase
MPYFLPLISSFLLAAVLTPIVRKIGLSAGLLSVPRARDVHKKPTPRIGGVGFFAAFVVVSAITFLIDNPTLKFGPGLWFGVDKHLVGIWLAGFVIVLSMLVDDVRGLKVWQKVFFQILAVAIVVSAGVGIDKISNPFGLAIDLNSVYIPIMKINGVSYHFSLWSDLFTLVWLVGMMNVINFVDGVDGLAAGISTIAAVTILLLSVSVEVSQPATALLAAILAGSTAGFLVWNFPPAKIFMGDSGSMFLGFMLGVLAIISGGKLATAFLVLGFPIIDGILVAGGRIMRGENPLTTPDKTHLHHRFLQAGFSVRQSIIVLYIISGVFGAFALQLKTLNKVVSAFVLVVLLIILIKVLNYRAKHIVHKVKSS